MTKTEMNEIQAYKQTYVVTFKKDPIQFVPESAVPTIYEAKKSHAPVMIGGELYDSNEILSVRKHVASGGTAKDILPEFQPKEREWVRERIAQRFEAVGKVLTAEEARRYVIMRKEAEEA